MRVLFFSILLLLSWSIQAQQKQCFEAIETVGCAPFTVRLTNCGESKNPIYIFDGEANDLSKAIQDTFFTYTEAGIYDIHQLVGTTTIETFTKTQYIRVVDNPTPAFETYSCEGRKVTVEITENYYDEYIIDFGDGSENVTIEGNSSHTHTYSDTLIKTITVRGNYEEVICDNSVSKEVLPITKLIAPTILFAKNNDNQTLETELFGVSYLSYASSIDSFSLDGSFTHITPIDSRECVYFSGYDVCGNQDISDSICAFSLESESINNEIKLTWDDYPQSKNLINYEVYRDGEKLAETNTTSFVDTEISCGTNYNYEIRTILTTGFYSISNSTSLQAISTDTPPQVTNLISTYQDNSILVSWDTLKTAETIRIHQQESILTTEDKSQFLDNNITNTISCYKISYTDICGNLSDTSSQTCPSLLTKSVTSEGIELIWNPYIGTENINYTLYWLDEEGSILKSNELSTETSFLDNEWIDSQEYFYQIAVDVNDQEFSYSNLVKHRQNSRVYFPTAFSPNNNGENDVFRPIGSFIQTYTITIYNQEGTLIYQGTDEGWDGKYKQKLAPIGVYVYFAEILDEENQKIQKQGTITIVP
ncbi:MAG: T9SS type B sorting domain-containing protein [Cytophagales bacterium]|nr:T9SS type B sorting domain-containing protein [Cytophagales bacterium]